MVQYRYNVSVIQFCYDNNITIKNSNLQNACKIKGLNTNGDYITLIDRLNRYFIHYPDELDKKIFKKPHKKIFKKLFNIQPKKVYTEFTKLNSHQLVQHDILNLEKCISQEIMHLKSTQLAQQELLKLEKDINKELLKLKSQQTTRQELLNLEKELNKKILTLKTYQLDQQKFLKLEKKINKELLNIRYVCRNNIQQTELEYIKNHNNMISNHEVLYSVCVLP